MKTQIEKLTEKFVSDLLHVAKAGTLERERAKGKPRGLAALPFEERSVIAKKAARTRKRRAAARKAVATRQRNAA